MKQIDRKMAVLMPLNDVQPFEDLNLLAPSRIAGLGVTLEQLNVWKN